MDERQKTQISLDAIYQPVQPLLERVPSAILNILSSENDFAREIIGYFFSSPGKFLRPALTFLGGEIKSRDSGTNERLLQLGSAFEIFHAATLIHDDIIDAAFVRRNIPTLNVKWGPEVAVLIGDYLHDKAIGSIFQNGNEKIVALFLQTAGEVCEGEIHELKEKNNFNLSQEEYFEIIRKKTAVLLACAVEAGGILKGATPEEAEALKRYGTYFGMAFQIVDDCLDFVGDQEEFGKTVGIDCSGGVLTLPVIRLIQLVDEKRKGEVFKIFKSEMATSKLQMLLQMLKEYETIEYSFRKAREFCEKAKLELSVFPDSPAKRSLLGLVDYVLQRKR